MQRQNWKVSDLTYTDEYHGYSVLTIVDMLNKGEPKQDIAMKLNITYKQLNIFIAKNLQTLYVLREASI